MYRCHCGKWDLLLLCFVLPGAADVSTRQRILTYQSFIL